MGEGFGEGRSDVVQLFFISVLKTFLLILSWSW